MEMDPNAVWLQLLRHCQSRDWAGYDPYDALNSPVLASVPIFRLTTSRIAFTQLLKRSPINLRPLLQVPPTQNPKALALFLSAVLRLPGAITADSESLPAHFASRLSALRSPSTSFWCWGYSFPWQSRHVLVDRGAPNLVCTAFVGQALLDLYERQRRPEHLAMAVSAAEYLLEGLYWNDGGSRAGFAYPLPSIRAQVHNANLLGSALLARVYLHSHEDRFLEPAIRVARYSAAQQRPDGSWMYGEAPSQQWIDNFHTGYNLCALHSLSESLNTDEFAACIERGMGFFRDHFFREDGAPRYFFNRTYPIDIHCVAQSIITLLELQQLHEDNFRLAWTVFRFAMKHMWNKNGYFHYRILPWGSIRTSYMRWSQAWMLLALSVLIDSTEATDKTNLSKGGVLAQTC